MVCKDFQCVKLFLNFVKFNFEGFVMAGVKRKLNVLSIKEKVKILKFLDENPLMKKGEVASKFNVPANTLSTIIKNRESIEQNFLTNKNAKRSRKCTFPEVDECVRKWFTQCRDEGIPISGQMLQRKAEDFAKDLGHGENFKGSNGWLESFKNRHGIVFRKLCGESASVAESVCEEWIKDIPAIVKDYEPKNIFNADETGLFYQCLPDKTAMFKNEDCRGGKQSKVRLTVLLAVNEDGSEKLPPLMIGRSEKPRCFANVKSFPFKYKANKKAWMTSEIFGDWLKSLDKSMQVKKRKIILFIDNCSAHNNLPALKNVTVKYFPANTTSKLQPLDQGVIRSFKVNYRKQLVRKLIDAIDEGSFPPKINVLDSMRMADYAWRNVTEKTVQNCFKKAGFKKAEECEEEKEIDEESENNENEFLEINSQEWNSVKSRLNVDISFEEFLQVDDSLATCGSLTDAEILDSVKCISEDEEETEDHNNAPRVTCKEAKKAVELLTTFLESQENVGHEAFQAIATLRKTIESKNVNRQMSLKDYFLNC